MKWHEMRAEEVEEQINSDFKAGLSETEAKKSSVAVWDE